MRFKHHNGATSVETPRDHCPHAEISHVGVVIPARDEADLIGDTISSVVAARRRLIDVDVSIVVVADACTDHTAAVARRLLSRQTDAVVVSSAGRAGAARRSGTDHFLAALPVTSESVWLANTDADTTVPASWLVDQIELARLGYVATAGIVDLHPHRHAFPGLRRRFGEAYAIEADGSHQHVHGANMGCRADAYLAVGGWNAMDVGEDHDLWDRLVDVGPTIATARLRVDTDPRRHGRAPDGFARDLDELSNTAATTAVTPPMGEIGLAV